MPRALCSLKYTLGMSRSAVPRPSGGLHFSSARAGVATCSRSTAEEGRRSAMEEKQLREEERGPREPDTAARPRPRLRTGLALAAQPSVVRHCVVRSDFPLSAGRGGREGEWLSRRGHHFSIAARPWSSSLAAASAAARPPRNNCRAGRRRRPGEEERRRRRQWHGPGRPGVPAEHAWPPPRLHPLAAPAPAAMATDPSRPKKTQPQIGRAHV